MKLSLDDLGKLTPEEKRIRIAELCPKAIKYAVGKWLFYDSQYRHWTECLSGDPLNDLNAMHEVEKMRIIINGRWDEYSRWLRVITERNGRNERFWGNATAVQRVDACLLVLTE